MSKRKKEFEFEEDLDTTVQDREDFEHPGMYKVILLNDHYTPMDFVVQVLEIIFRKSAQEAKNIMLAVHQKGKGVAGLYTKEIAESKIAIVHQLAKNNEFPLKCVMEPE